MEYRTAAVDTLRLPDARARRAPAGGTEDSGYTVNNRDLLWPVGKGIEVSERSLGSTLVSQHGCDL
jgi:hypothetical protein